MIEEEADYRKIEGINSSMLIVNKKSTENVSMLRKLSQETYDF